MSTDLITYLNYISSLNSAATDADISNIIQERQWFIELGKSDMNDKKDSAIDGVFDNIDKLAKQLEEEEIAQESVKLAEDAAAVGAIWSFGLSMAAFAALTATDVALTAAIKAKESDLYNHLKSVDKDIADKIGGVVSDYVNIFKVNNKFIKASSPPGLTPQTARSYLYNFMDYISLHGGIGVANFRKYVQLANKTKNDENIKKIYDILDEFSLSNKGPEEIKNALTKINGSGMHVDYLTIVRAFTFAIWMYKMNISSTEFNTLAKEAGVPPEECEGSVLENMDTLGKAMAAITIVLSIVDAFLNVYNIIETVKRYKKNIEVFKEARKQYKEYYKNVYNASTKYNHIATSSSRYR